MCYRCAATVPSYLSPLFVASVLDATGDDATAIKHAWAHVFVGVGGMALLVAAIYAAFISVDVVDDEYAKEERKKNK